MSWLPVRPDLDQLRRQARELHRAALAGDAGALRRSNAVVPRQQPARARTLTGPLSPVPIRRPPPWPSPGQRLPRR